MIFIGGPKEGSLGKPKGRWKNIQEAMILEIYKMKRDLPGIKYKRGKDDIGRGKLHKSTNSVVIGKDFSCNET